MPTVKSSQNPSQSKTQDAQVKSVQVPRLPVKETKSWGLGGGWERRVIEQCLPCTRALFYPHHGSNKKIHVSVFMNTAMPFSKSRIGDRNVTGLR